MKAFLQMNIRVLGKGAHCIVKLDNFSNSAIMEWLDSKFFPLPLKWKLQAALVSPEIAIYCLLFFCLKENLIFLSR
ncbi:Orotidine 5'-phosphate decarboxylase [Trichinella spiralis]|uniref:Orotidine 5'-phosphate decarboxylase n=1 Tax=Trichinella spiralis TaxID=6334 RepID=A0ABR3K9N3_TRISP